MRKSRFAARRGLLLTATVLFAAVLTAGFPSPASALTPVYRSTFSGTNVIATFVNNEECTPPHEASGGYFLANVFVVDGKYKDSITGHSSTSLIDLSLVRYGCADQRLFDGYGSVDLSSEQFTADDKLGSASVRATVPVLDDVSGSTTNVTVDLTWAAVGGPVTSKLTRKVTYPDGSKFSYQSKGSLRQATASGSVLVGAINFAPTATNEADIILTKTGDLIFTKS